MSDVTALRKACKLLQVLGLSSRHLRSFVLDSDPIPRALLSIDPTFSYVQSWSAVKGFMQIRQWFTGQPAETPAVNPARLLYANVGEVYLIKWTVGGGHKVRHKLRKHCALLSRLLQKGLVGTQCTRKPDALISHDLPAHHYRLQ